MVERVFLGFGQGHGADMPCITISNVWRELYGRMVKEVKDEFRCALQNFTLIFKDENDA